MIKKIPRKILYYINFYLGSLQNYLERKGLNNTIQYNTIQYNSKSENITHPYPINYKAEDKRLFHDECHYSDYNTLPQEIFELKNVTISYKGVVSKKLKTFVPALPHPIFRNTFGWLYLIGQKIFCKQKNGDTTIKYLLIYDHWSMANYYHWIIDSLSRIYLIRNQLSEYTILLPENPPKYILDSLSYFNTQKIHFIKKKEYFTVSCLHIQQYATGSGHQDPKILAELRTIFLPSKIIKGDKLIYVSRSQQKARKIINEKDVITILQDKGFQIVHFEELNFNEQVQIMKEAKILVTSHGAGETNTLFMPTGGIVLELTGNKKPNFCYWSMSDCLNLKYYYQLCSIYKKVHLLVDMDELKNNLQLILNCQN